MFIDRLLFGPGIDSKNDDAGDEMAVFTEAIKVPLRDHDAFPDIASSGDKNLQVEAFLKAHGRIWSFWKTR